MVGLGLVVLLLAGQGCRQDAEAQGQPDTDLNGKVVAGYQGWFAPEGDGANLGWFHYGVNHGKFEPGFCTFDMWPDVSEFDADELYATPFRFADGQVAKVFSSANRKTVDRHFKWMKDYGVDGAALQRFGSNLRSEKMRDWRDTILAHCREAADRHGRLWFIMYDLSGMNDETLETLIISDWKRLIDSGDFRKDTTHATYRGKPLVSLWGIGFDDNRRYSPSACAKLIDFLKNDPKYGGNAVMGGVPYFWREPVQTAKELRKDALPLSEMEAVYKQMDILSPWAVSRYADADEFVATLVKKDLAWCDANNIGYLPVFFPGFSWHNLEKARHRNAPLNFISRDGGKFLWRQAVAALQSGARMGYVAMFDEIDEGTAIFKVTNNPPVGDSPFATYEGLPSDHYLWLTGQIGKLLRNPSAADNELPKR
ncbi:MAG: hypothetical protein LBD30_07750, partial [Verrucomicrobiales bacterium]|jgi:hypothetical protein|nr:hypothetical protein [Verrucomicrobiales bacterium]